MSEKLGAFSPQTEVFASGRRVDAILDNGGMGRNPISGTINEGRTAVRSDGVLIVDRDDGKGGVAVVPGRDEITYQ